ncbi:MAG: efflux RND transporter periplasmic adaptor subunit, partial [Herminiimonas sp.]|nr:efflux RND transporter periplasmic adaptor subunit [Herminiimonas sp.]
MKTRYMVVVIGVAGAIGLAGYGLYRLGMQHAIKDVAPVAQATSSATERKPLYWHDPMVPGQKFDKPGKSPFMDMELV